MLYLIEVKNIQTEKTYNMFSTTNKLETNRILFKNNMDLTLDEVKRKYLFGEPLEFNVNFASSLGKPAI